MDTRKTTSIDKYFERDSQGRFTSEKKGHEQSANKCPECGKPVPVEDIRNVHFCSMVCETNFRYRQRHKDPMTGELPGGKEVNEW